MKTSNTDTLENAQAERNLYYYGARYLDPSDDIWLSVDPLWEKYVGMTPYQYCMWNPVRLVDTDGRNVDEFGLVSYQTNYCEQIELYRNESESFNKLYSVLESSEKTYYIVIGKTKNNDIIIKQSTFEDKGVLNDYIQYANNFAKYNTEHMIGNKHYQTPTETEPLSLQKITK